ncbi:MAG: T9SS type A sorting domain-containing protein [Chitinophagaceae bacterium]|nr:MAG: T9SS type A sorting domain-containing protein [Chitinophagaceae bacterium]
MPEASALRRVFGYWDIGGDHTSSSNQSKGNAPVPPGANGGYFVLVNASYNTDVAYNETLSNLCPNTYYEFSAWFRNLCPRCSCDSVGRGSGTTGFIPYPGNDSSGVRPNLSFEVDGLAYYTTGDIKYDRNTPWKKFGFTFLTKPGQTTANFAIRNNSPGGGGNDWAIDDITVAHCGPSITSNYNPFVLGCNANPFEVRLTDTVRSVYNNYIHFKWQSSNVGGTVWTNMTGPGTSGTGSPTMVNGMYQYITSLPPFLALPSDSGRYFRVIVATTASNLNSVNCAYNDGSSTMVRVINCGSVLTTNLLQFRAKKIEGHGLLNWTSQNEDDSLFYEVERSNDGFTFYRIGLVRAADNLTNSYSFPDPTSIASTVYYRLKAIRKDGLFIYSRIVFIPDTPRFRVYQGQNPFAAILSFNVVVPEDGEVHMNLFSADGRKLFSMKRRVENGMNEMQVERDLASGIYIMVVTYKDEHVRIRVRRE